MGHVPVRDKLRTAYHNPRLKPRNLSRSDSTIAHDTPRKPTMHVVMKYKYGNTNM
jgi:hypothetical protein